MFFALCLSNSDTDSMIENKIKDYGRSMKNQRSILSCVTEHLPFWGNETSSVVLNMALAIASWTPLPTAEFSTNFSRVKGFSAYKVNLGVKRFGKDLGMLLTLLNSTMSVKTTRKLV